MEKGIAQYHSVVFVRRDSGIRSLQDLTGRVLAFEEGFSSSGYLLPRISLAENGVSLAALDSPRAEPPADETGFVFSGDDENTVEWVLRGHVDAGAMSHAGLKKRAGDDYSKLEIITRTENIPRHVVSAAPDTSDAFAGALRTALLHLDQSAPGRDVLKGFEKTAKFDPIPPETRTMLDHFQPLVSALIGSN